MQHPDEGTIHAWLDGALPAGESAAVAAHVAECAQCAAAVAEARGFIAASSRILTALDNVPRGVVPAAPVVRRWHAPVWRAAAAVLVVAVGSLVVLRSDRNAPTSDARAISPQRAAMESRVPTADSATGFNDTVSPSNVLTLQSKGGSGAKVATVTERKPHAVTSVAATPAARETQQTDESRRNVAPRPMTVAAFDGANGKSTLRVVGTPRSIGQQTTMYEIAPGDTVTLTETSPLQLEQVAMGAANATGAANAAAAPMVRQPMAKAAAAPKTRASVQANAATDSSTSGANVTTSASVTSRAPVIAARERTGTARTLADSSSGVHTIEWVDVANGKVMRLTGRHSVGSLNQIRLQIERERAAADAKKSP